MRRSVYAFNASKSGASTPDSDEKSSIALPFKLSPPLALKALINFAWLSLLSFIGTLTEVFVTFPLEEDSFAPFVLCLLGPIAEDGRESILFAGSVMNGFVETGRLTIFSSRTNK